jgi:VanZ family protein
LLLTVVQGGVDELYQTTVPGRFADVYDFLADVTGGVLYAGWRKVRDRAVQETV